MKLHIESTSAVFSLRGIGEGDTHNKIHRLNEANIVLVPPPESYQLGGWSSFRRCNSTLQARIWTQLRHRVKVLRSSILYYQEAKLWIVLMKVLLAVANVYAMDEERSKVVRARGSISVGLEERDFELVSEWVRWWKLSSSASQKLEGGLPQSLQEAAQDDTLTVEWGCEYDRLILNMSKLGLTGDVSGLY